MWQRRFWGRQRKWNTKKRPRAITLSERGVYEPVELEEDVVKKIIALLWYSGIPCFRERERVPRCPACGKNVCRPSDAGHSDLHGIIPARLFKSSDASRKWGVPFYIECKRPNGGIETRVQEEFLDRVRRDGAIGFFARSWKEVRDTFMKYGVQQLPEG